MKRSLINLFFLILAACAYDPGRVTDDVSQNMVTVDGTHTVIETFRSDRLSGQPVLLVALHGDTAPWDRSGAQYDFAERIARDNDNVIAVGMVRPGYVDPEGRTSDGPQGDGVGDNYGQPQIDQIAAAIRELKKRHNAARVILVGESGGAATAANIVSVYPDLVDQAVLIVCPCDVVRWRAHMAERTGKYDVFGGAVDILSPIDLVENVSDRTNIALIAGSEDPVAPPDLVKSYHAALIGAGKHASFTIVEGGHGIFLAPDVLSKVNAIVAGEK